MTVPKPRNYYTQPKFIDVNGLNAACRRKGGGEPVVFLHGAIVNERHRLAAPTPNGPRSCESRKIRPPRPSGVWMRTPISGPYTCRR